MTISLAGNPASDDCIHHWKIVGTQDINPRTKKLYGKNTPGVCENCGLERMFDSVPTTEHGYSQFRLSKKDEVPPD